MVQQSPRRLELTVGKKSTPCYGGSSACRGR